MNVHRLDQMEAAIRDVGRGMDRIAETVSTASTKREAKYNDFLLAMSELLRQASRRRCKHLRKTPAQPAFLYGVVMQANGWRPSLLCAQCVNRWVKHHPEMEGDNTCEVCREKVDWGHHLAFGHAHVMTHLWVCDRCKELANAEPSERALEFADRFRERYGVDVFSDDSVEVAVQLADFMAEMDEEPWQ